MNDRKERKRNISEVVEGQVAESQTLMPAATSVPQESSTDETDRTPRALETREKTGRKSDHFIPASALPVPNEQDGYRFKWVRVSMLGKADNTNASKKFREGWVAVKAGDHPELMVDSDYNARFTERGNLQVGGLLLCKTSIGMIRQREKYFRQKNERQAESVSSNYMRESDPRMPLSNTDISTRTEFGRG